MCGVVRWQRVDELESEKGLERNVLEWCDVCMWVSEGKERGGKGKKGYRMPGTRGTVAPSCTGVTGGRVSVGSLSPGVRGIPGCAASWGRRGGVVPNCGVVDHAVVPRLVLVGTGDVRVVQRRGGGTRGQARPAGVARGDRVAAPLPPVVVLLGASGVWGSRARCPVLSLEEMVVLVLSRTSVKKANSEKSSTRWGGVTVESTRPAV